MTGLPTRKEWLLVVAMLSPPYLALLFACYWLFVDTAAPLVINYQHPKFSSVAVATREEAKANEIDEIDGGAVAYLYREFCVNKVIHGELRARWVTSGMVWPVDDRSFVSSEMGCHQNSFAVNVPTSNPTRKMRYESVRVYHVNPLVEVSVPAPPVTVTVKANK